MTTTKRTSTLAGKVQRRCDVCRRRYYYLSKLAAPMELRPWRNLEGMPERVVALPAGALVCDKCTQFNGAQRRANPLPLQRPGKLRLAANRRPLQTLIGQTLSNPEAERLRAVAAELRAVGDALVEQGRMSGTRDRLEVFADELIVMSQAAELDITRIEGNGRALAEGQR